VTKQQQQRNSKESNTMIKTAKQHLVLSLIDRRLEKVAEGRLEAIKAALTMSPERLKAIKDFGMNYGDDIGIGVGAAGLAGLGGAAALRNIKSLQRTNPGAFARLMGAQPTGLTRGQISALGGGLGLGAGVGAGMNAELLENLAMSGYGRAKGLYDKLMPAAEAAAKAKK
jgi:ABC-type amino acid transport substrate-binding protein